MTEQIDLQQFCFKEETRPYICQPFSLGDFTYATNGHIIVRVARRPEVGEQDVLTDKSLSRAFVCHDNAEFKPLPKFSVPGGDRETCEYCAGTGEEDDENPSLTCFECDGKGTVAVLRSIAIGGVSFNVDYLLQLQTLPALSIQKRPIADSPMPFIFDGGIGTIMPIKGTHRVHLGSFKDFIVKNYMASA